MSRLSSYARPRTGFSAGQGSAPRKIDARSPAARDARISGGNFDISGNLLGGRDQMTGQPLQGPQAPSALDQAAERLGWNKPKPSRYQAALAQAAQPAQGVSVADAGQDAADKISTKPQDGAAAARGVHTAQVGGSSPSPATNFPSAKPVSEPTDWLHQAGAMLGHAVGTMGRYAGSLLGLNGPNEQNAPGVGPVEKLPGASDETSAKASAPATVTAPFNATDAMAGQFRNAGWAQPGDTVTRDGSGMQINGQTVQPTGRMAMSVWGQQNGTAGMGTAARPGQRFSEMGQAIMDRTGEPSGPSANSGHYMTQAADGSLVQSPNNERRGDGGYRQSSIALLPGEPAAEGKGVATAGGREISGAYGSGTSRFNVPDSAPGAIYDENGLAARHVPAGAPVLNDGPGGRQVVTRAPAVQTQQTDFPKLAAPDSTNPKPDDEDEEEANRQGRYAGALSSWA